MAEVRHVRMPSGELVWVRVEADGADRPHDVASRPDQVIPLEGFTEAVRGVAASVTSGLRNLAPDTVTVEFGLAVTLKTGRLVSVLADAGGTADVKVKLTWNGSGAGGAVAAGEDPGAGAVGSGPSGGPDGAGAPVGGPAAEEPAS